MTRTALVTGGAGFIGSHLTERLLRDGWRVRILENFTTGSLENLGRLRREVEVFEGDTRDPEVCRGACRGVDTVFHMAAAVSVSGSVADPAQCHEVNVAGTLNLLMSAREHEVRRVVFSSSAAVYGNADAFPTQEEQILLPQSPYATSKACGEFYCRNFWELYGLETVVLRYFNVFGPRQSATSAYAAVIPRFLQAAVEGRTPVVYGDGRQTRDFVYVENVVSANIRASQAKGVAGQVFNIAGGRGISLICLLAEIERLTGRTLAPEFRPARPGEVRHSCADISRARSGLGYEPAVSFALGLEQTLASSAGCGAAASIA